MPTLEGGAPHHFLARCLDIRHRGQPFLPREGASRRNLLTPASGTRRPDFNYVVLTSCVRRPRPWSALSPLPLGCLNVRGISRFWCPCPEEISASLLLRCLNTMMAGSFLNEPRPFFLVFPYIARKENSRLCILKLIFLLG